MPSKASYVALWVGAVGLIISLFAYFVPSNGSIRQIINGSGYQSPIIDAAGDVSVTYQSLSNLQYQRLLDRLSELSIDHEIQKRLLNSLLDQLDVKAHTIFQLQAQVDTYKDRIKGLLASENISEVLKRFLDNGDIDGAEALVDKIYEDDLKGQEVSLAKNLYERGEIKRLKLKYSDSAEAFVKAAVLEPSNSFYANAAGYVLMELGQYDIAIEYFDRALKIDLKNYGKNSSELGVYQNNLGEAWHAKGNYEKAIEYFKLALDGGLKDFGRYDPRVASRYNNLASVLLRKGNYEEAIKFYRLAMDITLVIYDEEHPALAIQYNNLSAYFAHVGNYNEAILNVKLALDIDLKNFGEGHPGVALERSNLGVYIASLGNYDEAIKLVKLALDSNLKNFGEVHPTVARDRSNLGQFYAFTGNYGEGINQLNLALECLKHIHGDSHPDISFVAQKLSMFKKINEAKTGEVQLSVD